MENKQKLNKDKERLSTLQVVLDKKYGLHLSEGAEKHRYSRYSEKKIVTDFVNQFINPAHQLSHDHQWKPSEYLVSEKADGPRCLVLCSCDGSVWCVRPQKQSLLNRLKAENRAIVGIMSSLIPNRVCFLRRRTKQKQTNKITLICCMLYISLVTPTIHDATQTRQNTWISRK